MKGRSGKDEEKNQPATTISHKKHPRNASGQHQWCAVVTSMKAYSRALEFFSNEPLFSFFYKGAMKAQCPSVNAYLSQDHGNARDRRASVDHVETADNDLLPSTNALFTFH
jgi:hypothetical protein